MKIHRERLLVLLAFGAAGPSMAAPAPLDTDRDGIPDHDDLCPSLPDDNLGRPDGCPEPAASPPPPSSPPASSPAPASTPTPGTLAPTSVVMVSDSREQPADLAGPGPWYSCDGEILTRNSASTDITMRCADARVITLHAGFGKTFPSFLAVGVKGTAWFSQADVLKATEANLFSFRTPAGDDIRPEEPSLCFLTTAISLHRGQSDDCEELTVLRAWRERYLRPDPQRAGDIARYEQIAPRIVAAVDGRHNPGTVWDVLYADYLVPILALVRMGHDEEVHAAYRQMVDDLALGLGVVTC